MKVAESTIDEVIAVIYNSPLRTEISGVIARRKPINSTKEDIIVNSPGIIFTQLQEGIVNVNIHVPNVSKTSGGVTDNEYPNYPRLKTLSEMAIPILKNYIDEGVYFQVQRQQVIEEQKSSYSNIRLTIQAKNL